MFPGSTADCLAFESMTLFKDLEEGLLHHGLCLFGNKAYLNAIFCATPYSGGILTSFQDAYNFYHSQLQVSNIECAFG